MFGSELERYGVKKLLTFLFYNRSRIWIGYNAFWVAINIPIVGASGAIYGVLLAYGVMFPNRTVYLYGIIPIKSIWFVIGIGVIAFFSRLIILLILVI